MANKISKDIEDAQAQLHVEVRNALSKFSETTGLSVRHINWSVTRILDHLGNTKSLSYYEMRSCLESSLS